MGFLREDILSPCNLNQLAHPPDRREGGLVPLLEVDSRPPLKLFPRGACLRDCLAVPVHKRSSLVLCRDYPAYRHDDVQYLLDAPLVENEDL